MRISDWSSDVCSSDLLPNFADVPLTKKAAHSVPAPNPDGPGFGKKVVLYATCYGNFNDQTPGEAAMKVLAHNGVHVRVEHPECCGMPKFENGDLTAVASAAARLADNFATLIADGYDIVTVPKSRSEERRVGRGGLERVLLGGRRHIK